MTASDRRARYAVRALCVRALCALRTISATTTNPRVARCFWRTFPEAAVPQLAASAAMREGSTAAQPMMEGHEGLRLHHRSREWLPGRWEVALRLLELTSRGAIGSRSGPPPSRRAAMTKMEKCTSSHSTQTSRTSETPRTRATRPRPASSTTCSTACTTLVGGRASRWKCR